MSFTLLLIFTTLITFSGCNSGGSGGGSGGTVVPPHETNSHEVPREGVDDPLASYAWHLENTGQSSFSSAGGVAGEDLDIKEVHQSGIKGAGVKIAVSDTGVDLYHTDIAGNQLSGEHRDYSSNDSSTWRNANPYPTENEGHGTGVAGLIAALGWNGIGSRGVAPAASFAGFLYIGDFSSTEASYEAKSIDQMTGNFDIFNYSYGYPGCSFYQISSTEVNAYKNGVTNLRAGKGAIYVQAAGNDYVGANSDCTEGDNSSFIGNTNTSEDHNLPYVILAASVNARGKASSYSSPGSGVWVSAAGGEFGTTSPAMITTDILSCNYGLSVSTSGASDFNKGSNPLNRYCNYTNVMNGTSSATPVLSGIIALMLEANPNLTWRDVKHILAKTADPINYSTAKLNHPAGTSYNLPGHDYDYLYVLNKANNKYSNTYGFGRVNANAAVTMAKTYVSALGTYLESAWLSSGALSLDIPDNAATGVTNSINVTTNYSIESVQLQISTDHTYVGDLGVELLSPQGTRSKLLLINSNIKDQGLVNFTLITNAFYEEPSAGLWQIKVIDGAASDTGKLTNWKIRINGH